MYDIIILIFCEKEVLHIIRRFFKQIIGYFVEVIELKDDIFFYLNSSIH